MKNKTGDITDGLVFVVIIFVISVFFISISYIFPIVTTALNDSSLNAGVESQEAIDNLDYMAKGGLNSGFIIFFGGLILVQVISAAFVRQSPIFLVIYFFTMVIAGLLAIFLGNAFDLIQENSTLQSVFDDQPAIEFVMDNILIITLAINVLTIVILFSKVGQGPI
jgi:hypothetical protein